MLTLYYGFWDTGSCTRVAWCGIEASRPRSDIYYEFRGSLIFVMCRLYCERKYRYRCSKCMHWDKKATGVGRRVVIALPLLTLCITIHKSSYCPSSTMNCPLGSSDKVANIKTFLYTTKILRYLFFISLLYFFIFLSSFDSLWSW